MIRDFKPKIVEVMGLTLTVTGRESRNGKDDPWEVVGDSCEYSLNGFKVDRATFSAVELLTRGGPLRTHREESTPSTYTKSNVKDFYDQCQDQRRQRNILDLGHIGQKEPIAFQIYDGKSHYTFDVVLSSFNPIYKTHLPGWTEARMRGI